MEVYNHLFDILTIARDAVYQLVGLFRGQITDIEYLYFFKNVAKILFLLQKAVVYNSILFPKYS